MSSASRERQLVSTFVTLADTLVVGYDVVELLQTLVDSCAQLLDAAAVGIMLADEHGDLSVVASTTESTELIDLLQRETGGPGIARHTSGALVAIPDVSVAPWSGFAAAAAALGIGAAFSFPLRLRTEVIGTLSVFRAQPGTLNADDASVAQGLADVATIGILHERALREQNSARLQLQGALESRIIIEQAKGVIAQLRGYDMDSAFRLLRDHARANRLHLRDVAELVVARQLTL